MGKVKIGIHAAPKFSNTRNYNLSHYPHSHGYILKGN